MQRTCLVTVVSALPFQHLCRSLLKECCRDSGFPGCITGSASCLCFCFRKSINKTLKKVLKALTVFGWNFQMEKKHGEVAVQVSGDVEFNLKQLIRNIMCFALLALSFHLSLVLCFRPSSSLALTFPSFLMINAKNRMTQLPDTLLFPIIKLASSWKSFFSFFKMKI